MVLILASIENWRLRIFIKATLLSMHVVFLSQAACCVLNDEIESGRVTLFPMREPSSRRIKGSMICGLTSVLWEELWTCK